MSGSPKSKAKSMSTLSDDDDTGTGVPLSPGELLILMHMLGILGPPPEPLMHEGDVVKKYEFVKQLGEGASGEVWAVQKDEKKYAIKVIRDNDHTVQTELLFTDKHLKCPFLVEYIESFRNTEHGVVFIVMELCEQGDLQTLVKKCCDPTKGIGLQAHRIVKIFTQLILGIHELHEHNIIHRDLKLGNVFVDDKDNIKIGDFGIARVLGSKNDLTKTLIGTPAYMSPEMHGKEAYGRHVDLWALGIMMYNLCTGRLPFVPDKGMADLEEKIKVGKFDPIPKLTAPDPILNDIYALLSKDPQKRPSTGDLLRNPIIREMADENGLAKYFPKGITASHSTSGGWSKPAGTGGPGPYPIPSSGAAPYPSGPSFSGPSYPNPSAPSVPRPTSSASSFDDDSLPRSSAPEDAAFQELQTAATRTPYAPLFTAGITYKFRGATVALRQVLAPFQILKISSPAKATAGEIRKSFNQLIKSEDRILRALVCLSHVAAMGHVYKKLPAYFRVEDANPANPTYRFDAASPIVWALAGYCPGLRALSRNTRVAALKTVKTAFGESLAYLGVRSNMWDVVELMLEQGCVVNDVQSCGSSLLHAAAYFEHTNLAHYLIRRGANLAQKKPGAEGSTPLGEAAEKDKRGLQATAAQPIPSFLCTTLQLKDMGEMQHVLHQGRLVAIRLVKRNAAAVLGQNWYEGWRGLGVRNVPSVVNQGLQAAPNGIYVTKALRNECSKTGTTERLTSQSGTRGTYCVLVEAALRPGAYSEEDSGKVARVDDEEDAVVTAVTIVNWDFISKTDIPENKLFGMLRGKVW